MFFLVKQHENTFMYSYAHIFFTKLHPFLNITVHGTVAHVHIFQDFICFNFIVFIVLYCMYLFFLITWFLFFEYLCFRAFSCYCSDLCIGECQ